MSSYLAELFTRQIEDNRRALVHDALCRYDESLEPFNYDLDCFLAIFFEKRLPADWRRQWHDFVAEQAAQGYFIEPESDREMEEWIEAWARYCELLPHSEVPFNRPPAIDRLASQDAVVHAEVKSAESAVTTTTQTQPPLTQHPANGTDSSRAHLIPASYQANSSQRLVPVVIYIDTTVTTQAGRPVSLDPQMLAKVQGEMNMALKNARIGVTVKLVPSAPPAGTTLGFEKAGIFGFRSLEAYNHEVTFGIGKAGGTGLAMTGRPGHTKVLGNRIDARFRGITPTRWANILLHEVFYLGLGIGNDEANGPQIRRPSAGSSLVDLSPIANDIIAKLSQ